MSGEFGFEVAGRVFTITAASGAEDVVHHQIGAFASSRRGGAQLLLEWHEGSSPPGAMPITSADGVELGWAARSGRDVRVAMLEPGAVSRGLALLIASSFRPPRFALLHSAGLRIGDRGLVAVGPSGAGKSTLSTLFEEATVLSDETVLLEDGDPPLLHATPLRSSSPRRGEPGSARLRAVLALVQSRDVRLSELGGADALALLLEQSLTQDPGELQSCFELASSVVAKVPRHTLHFRKDRDFVPLLTELLK